MRYLAAFLAGMIAWSLALWLCSDRTGQSLTVSPRRVETRVTIHVGQDPTHAIPSGNVAQFLQDLGGLKEAERKSILDGVATNFISQLSIEYTATLPGRRTETKGIWFDAVDGKFSKHVGTYGGSSGPRLN